MCEMVAKYTNTDTVLSPYNYYIVEGSVYMTQKEFKRYVRKMTKQTLSSAFSEDDIIQINNEDAYSVKQMFSYNQMFSSNYMKSDILLKELLKIEAAYNSQKNELKDLLHHKQAIINNLTTPTMYTKRDMVHNIIKHKASVPVMVARWRALYAEYNRHCKTNVGLLLTNNNKLKEAKKYKNKIEFIDEKLEDIDTLLKIAVSLFERSYHDFLKHMKEMNSNEEIRKTFNQEKGFTDN